MIGITQADIEQFLRNNSHPMMLTIMGLFITQSVIQMFQSFYT